MTTPSNTPSGPSFTSFVSETAITGTDDLGHVTTVRFTGPQREMLVVKDADGRQVFLYPNEALHLSVAIRRLIESEVFITQPLPEQPVETPPAVVPAQAVLDFDDPLN